MAVKRCLRFRGHTESESAITSVLKALLPVSPGLSNFIP